MLGYFVVVGKEPILGACIGLFSSILYIIDLIYQFLIFRYIKRKDIYFISFGFIGF